MKETYVEQKLQEINERLFELEGRMNMFERVSQIEGKQRTEMLEQVLRNQDETEKKLLKKQEETENRIHRIELRLAGYVGGGVVIGSVLGTVINLAVKLYAK